MEPSAQPPSPPPPRNPRLPKPTKQPTKTTPQGWCTLIRPEVVHFEVTGDTWQRIFRERLLADFTGVVSHKNMRFDLGISEYPFVNDAAN
jgi:hypothetical protein